MDKKSSAIADISFALQVTLVIFLLRNSSELFPGKLVSNYKGIYAVMLGALFCYSAIATLHLAKKTSRFMSFEAGFLVVISLGTAYFFSNCLLVSLPALWLNLSRLFIHIPSDIYKQIIRIACLALICILVVALLGYTILNITFDDFGRTEKRVIATSPKGLFKLVLVKISDGALGGSQAVLVQEIKPRVELGVFGRFLYQKEIYHCRYSDSVSAFFVDDFSVIINGEIIDHLWLSDPILSIPINIS